MKKVLTTTNLNEINKMVASLGWDPTKVKIEVKMYEDLSEPDVTKTQLVLVK